MNGQLYTAASGLLLSERRVEVIANNLANVSSAGFRARRTFATEYAGSQSGPLDTNRSTALAGDYELPHAGALQYTGRPLDLALSGDQLLVVRGDNGRLYTRSGALDIDPKGRLVDVMGRPVLDSKGATIDGLTSNVRIGANGVVSEGESERGRLLVMSGPQEILTPTGGNAYSAPAGTGEMNVVEDPELQPGWIEASGVEPVGELVRLMEAQRAFDAYQRLISVTMNEVNRRTVNDIAG